MLPSQQKSTVNKGPKARSIDDFESMYVKAVIKEAMIFLLDTIERQEEEKLKLSNINADNLAEARRKLHQAGKEVEQAKKGADEAKAELEELKRNQLT